MRTIPPIKYNRLDCSGNGFTFDSYSRAPSSEVADALNAHYPLFANASHANTNTPQTHPKSWWEAQVRLYNLNCSRWTIDGMKETLRNALRSGPLHVDEDMRQKEETYNDLWCTENVAFQRRVAAAILNPGQYTELNWSQVKAAIADKKRLLREIAFLGDVRGLPGLNSRSRSMFCCEAKNLGLVCGLAPDTLVIGKDREDVQREVNRIAAEDRAAAKACSEARAARWQAERDEIERMHQQMLESGDKEDITGMWQVKMPKLHTWGPNRDRLRWYIAGSDGTGTVWGTHDIIGRGVLQFAWGEAGSAWKEEEKTFVYRDTRVIDPKQESLECRLLGGTVTFTSANTCVGVWDWGDKEKLEFSGRKLGIDTGASVEKCKKEFEAAEERVREYIQAGYND